MKRGCKVVPKDDVKDPLNNDVIGDMMDSITDSLLQANRIDADDWNGLSESIAHQLCSIENQALKEVAKQCLGREFEPKDADRFLVVVPQGWIDKYYLLFQGETIGIIDRHYAHNLDDIDLQLETKLEFRVTFTPIKPGDPVPYVMCEKCEKATDERYECESCSSLIGSCCQTEYNQFSQIDYNCCKTCAERNID